MGSSSLGENIFIFIIQGTIILQADGKGAERKELLFYNQHLQQSISKQTTRQTLKQVGYVSRKPNWVPLLSTEIRTKKLIKKNQ